MKRMHVNLSVTDLDQSIGFYSALFSAEPDVLKRDYAKWMLEDPRVNFSITTRGKQDGLDHLGIQVESENELGEVYTRLKQAGGPIIEEGSTTCCYANSDKNWIFDPEGVAWETFYTHGESPVYGNEAIKNNNIGQTCCTPDAVNGPIEKSSCC
ncbi:MAG: ArsI/CadI family heavy metal resistance metalloenzyme [Pseudomonadota bacterium]